MGLKRRTRLGSSRRGLAIPDRGGERFCPGCGAWKPLDRHHFKKLASGPFSFSTHCLECPQPSKLGNCKTEHNGRIFDSRFEAECAAQLELWLRLRLIENLEYQYRVDMTAYDRFGVAKLHKSHKVDFRVTHLPERFPTRYELIEAKGFETQDYRDRLKWLEGLWLPEHPDHTYTVIRRVNQLTRRVP